MEFGEVIGEIGNIVFVICVAWILCSEEKEKKVN